MAGYPGPEGPSGDSGLKVGKPPMLSILCSQTKFISSRKKIEIYMTVIYATFQ